MEELSKEIKREFLEVQRMEILKGNFRNEIAEALQNKRLELAKKEGDKDKIRAVEDELEHIENSKRGNTTYLEVINDFLGEL